jgi:acyl-CoA synthetase (NDP forming)
MDGLTPKRGPLAPGALNRLLRPASIAIVGASPTLGSLGASVLGNLERMGFAGDIHLINPNRAEVSGRPCLPSARDLPMGVDCAVLAVPRAAVLDAVRDCAASGVGGVIIYAVGFAEEGPEGLAQQEDIARIAAGAGMVVEGPNCLGMVNYIDGAPLTFVETPARRLTGRGIAIVSQSGAIAAILSVSLHARDVPLSFTVSTGNEALSGVEDYLEYMIADEQTSAITIIAEHFRDPPRLLSLARRAVAAAKPIILLHPGRSSAARASAATHTGAMVGDDAVMRVMTEAAGLILVDSLAEALDVTELVARCGTTFGTGLMLLTESGAFKALALDQCGALALSLPGFSAATAARLREVIPAFIPATNPLDLTAQALVDPAIYQRALAAVLDDAAYGAVMFGIILSDETTSGRKLPAIIEALKALKPTKPVIVAGLDEGAAVPPALAAALRELGVPFFASAERVFTAIARLQARREPRGANIEAGMPAARLPAGIMPEYRAKLLLRDLGLRIPPGQLARTEEEALTIANGIGYPVVLKAQSAAISHKSDVGGVVLNLAKPEALRDGWDRLRQNLQRHCPNALLDGVLVEAMGRRGTELIIGARRDPDWGPVLLAGFGGIMAEALQDVRLLPPGLDQTAIIAELRKLKSAAILDGFRGLPALDVPAAAEIVMKLDGFLQAHPEIIEVDINPVVLYAEGEGALVLDALMQVA